MCAELLDVVVGKREKKYCLEFDRKDETPCLKCSLRRVQDLEQTQPGGPMEEGGALW